jgi:hypothetical protein
MERRARHIDNIKEIIIFSHAAGSRLAFGRSRRVSAAVVSFV